MYRTVTMSIQEDMGMTNIPVEITVTPQAVASMLEAYREGSLVTWAILVVDIRQEEVDTGIRQEAEADMAEPFTPNHINIMSRITHQATVEI